MYTFKKSLGQHFLKDENVSRNIINELQKCDFTRLVEVGPGGGALTKYLLQIPGIEFRAIEIDEEKIIFLNKTYPSIKDQLIHSGFLEIDLPFNGPFAVIGNFPYNISTQILFKLLEWDEHVQCIIGMFQKEVALRIAAREGNKVYGVTSVLVQAFFDVFYLFDVSENSFMPPPRVKSGVIKLLPRKERLHIKDKQSLFTLVKHAFGQRRKTLRNACSGLFESDILQLPVFDKRAEQLSVKEFGQLTFKLK